MLVEFKTLVDQSDATIKEFYSDHEAVCRFLEIDTSNGFARTWVTDKLRDNIRQNLEPKADLPILSYQNFLKIEKALIYDSIFHNNDNGEYLTIVRTIRDVNKNMKALSFQENWKKAIECAKNYNIFSPSTYFQAPDLRDSYPRAFDVATAAKELRELGCNIELKDLDLIVSGTEKLVEQLENKIKKLGATFVIECFFKNLEIRGNYFTKINKFLILSQTSFDPSQTGPMIPYGFLLNLAIKHSKENPEFKKSQKEVQKGLDYINKVSTLLSTTIDIRSYQVWDNFFQSEHSLPEYLRNIALYDTIFTFPSSDICRLPMQLEALFSWVDNTKFESLFSFSISEYISVVKAIIEISRNTNGPVNIYVSAIKKNLKELSSERLLNSLVSMSHTTNVNQGLRFLTDFNECDFGFKPLIQVSPTKFLLADKSWCANAFYESLATMSRLTDLRDADNKIGLCLELYVQKLLAENGIAFFSGNYAGINSGEGECDILIETDAAIVLIEIKKKALTRRSRSGIDTGIVVDLAASLFDAQLQAGRTELILRKQGYIEIESQNKQIYKVELKNRNIERVALTLHDFGSFQDRSVINRILSIMVNTQVDLIDKSDKELVTKFEKIKQKNEEWQIQAAELQTADEGFDHFPFFNCWFLSLPQLQLLLSFSEDNESFYRELTKVKHVSFGSSNFYFEYYMNSGMALNN